jgi:hypothetical protein
MTVLYEPGRRVGLDDLEDELCRAFEAVRDAGEPVVVALPETDVAGAGDPVAAALAHGVIGIVRALAIEGRRINALAVPAGLAPADRETWIERLAEPAGANGALIRLGTDHLGRVPA